VAPAAKLGGQMIKGVVPFDGAKAAKAMNDISGVPDKYVTLFPEGEVGVAMRTAQSPA
jgi:cytochrome c556